MTNTVCSIPKDKVKRLPFPWPLPPEGCEIEVARWCRLPTQHRYAQWEIYSVRVSVWDLESCVVSFNARHVQEDTVHKGRRPGGLIPLPAEEELVRVNLQAKCPPSALLQVFEVVAGRVRLQAEKDQAPLAAACARVGKW